MQAQVGAASENMTMREMIYACDQKQILEWNHTAFICAINATFAQQVKRPKIFKPRDFHPLNKSYEKYDKKRLSASEGKQALSATFGLKDSSDGK